MLASRIEQAPLVVVAPEMQEENSRVAETALAGSNMVEGQSGVGHIRTSGACRILAASLASAVGTQ